MKNSEYNVCFIDGDSLIIPASTPLQALCLAMSKKIEKGQPYAVDSITDMTNKRFFVTKKDNFNNLLKEI